VPILINILIMLCISLYRIGNGGNKLFVFVFVFVKCSLLSPVRFSSESTSR
jgi:hypothetical protein